MERCFFVENGRGVGSAVLRFSRLPGRRVVKLRLRSSQEPRIRLKDCSLTFFCFSPASLPATQTLFFITLWSRRRGAPCSRKTLFFPDGSTPQKLHSPFQRILHPPNQHACRRPKPQSRPGSSSRTTSSSTPSRGQRAPGAHPSRELCFARWALFLLARAFASCRGSPSLFTPSFKCI